MSARAQWMGVLSRARPDDVKAIWSQLGEDVPFEWLRKPQTGLVMISGRAGGTGNPFNMGEVPATRCSIKLGDGIIGHAFVQGRDQQHAEFAAVFDALLQHEEQTEFLVKKVIDPLRTREQEHAKVRSRKAAATKVDFFTMARAEKPK